MSVEAQAVIRYLKLDLCLAYAPAAASAHARNEKVARVDCHHGEVNIPVW